MAKFSLTRELSGQGTRAGGLSSELDALCFRGDSSRHVLLS